MWLASNGLASGRVRRSTHFALIGALLLVLAGCADQIPAGISHGESVPGFWWGLWHGFVFPFAWIGSLFNSDIAVYAVPNRGGWYDFGFFFGITVLGGGSFFGSKKRRD